MRCSRCGSDNPENARFCGDCGLEISQQVPYPEEDLGQHVGRRPEPGTALSLICPNCGVTSIPKDNTCDHCGTPLTVASVSASPEARPNDVSRDMAQPAAPPEFGHRGLGDFFAETVRIYRRYPKVFLAISVAPQIPALFGLVIPSLPAEVVFTILGVAIGAIAQGAVIITVAHIYSGHAPSTAVSYRRAYQLGLTLVAGQFFLLLLLAASSALILFLIGIPMLIFFIVLLAFFPQAVVIERMGMVAAFRRSAVLVQGDWWRIFGIGCCYGSIVVIPMILALVLVSASAPFFGFAAMLVIGTAAMPWMLIGATLVYFDLRLRKEDFTLETLAGETLAGETRAGDTGLD